jgi:hypothetical protein
VLRPAELVVAQITIIVDQIAVFIIACKRHLRSPPSAIGPKMRMTA